MFIVYMFLVYMFIVYMFLVYRFIVYMFIVYVSISFCINSNLVQSIALKMALPFASHLTLCSSNARGFGSLDRNSWEKTLISSPFSWVISHVPIEHHPASRYMVYNGNYKVMSNIPKLGHLPTPDFFWEKKTMHGKSWNDMTCLSLQKHDFSKSFFFFFFETRNGDSSADGKIIEKTIFGSVDSNSWIAKLVNGVNASRLVNGMVYGRYI